MRMRIAAAGLAVVAALGGGSAFAQHPLSQPSQHCNGTTPGDPFSTGQNKVPVGSRLDTKQPGVCFNLVNGSFKGAVWVDFATNSIVVDGDSTNGTSMFGACSDGYAGVRLSGDPHLLFSQGSNYNPTSGESDGGVNGTGNGSANDRFDPTTESGELQSCFVG